MDPCFSALLLLEDDDTIEILTQELNLKKYNFIFMIVNDNQDKFKQEGGNHWCLLIYEKKSNIFFCFDSFSLKNPMENAIFLSKKIGKILNKGWTFDQKSNFVLFDNTPQQINSFDCGCFSLVFSYNLIKMICSEQNFEFNDKNLKKFKENFDLNKTNSFRHELKEIILNLINIKK